MRRRLLAVALAGVALLAGVPGHRPAQSAAASAALTRLYRRAEDLQKAGNFREAAKVYERALRKARKDTGKSNPTTATLMNSLALVYRALGRYAEAESLFQRSLKIRRDKLGKNHADVGVSLNNLALLYHDMGEQAKAEPLYLRGLKIMRAKLGKNHPNVATALNNLALLYQEMSEFAESERLYRQSLKARQSRLGKNHSDVGQSLHNLAVLYRAMGQYARAEPLYQRCLKSWRAKLGKNHPHVAAALNNLALLYQDMGQPAKAESLYLQGLKIREARLGKNHPDVAASLNSLAGLYQSMGQHAKAERLFRRSLKILEAKLGEDHPSVASALNNLAGLYEETGRATRAVPLHRRSLEICKARLGSDHPAVATSLNNLAVLYHGQGWPAKAEPLLLRSLAIREARLGTDHPDVAQSLNNLGGVYQALGRYTRARACFQRSLRIKEARLGKDHPGVASALYNLAGVVWRTGRYREAARIYDRARRSARRHFAAVLPALSEADKAAFFQNTSARSDLEGPLSLALAHPTNATLAALSASWLLNGKAVDQESLTSSLLLARQTDDPKVGQLSRRLQAVRQELARLTLSRPARGQEKERSRRIEELTGQELDLGKKLRQAGSKSALPDWVGLDDLRRALPADAVLIDVARFRRFDPKAGPTQQRWRPARYAAWVTPKSGRVRLVDLGPAERIDAAVQRLREAMQGSAKLVKDRGENQAENSLREPLRALSRLVLEPLLPHVGSSKCWLISPDGNLWLVPWEALTLPGGAYAVEKHHLSYLTTGRDLLAAPAAEVKRTAPLVLADPDFDLDPAKARKRGKRGRGAEEGTGTRALAGSLRLGSVPRLPGTAAEARAITPSLKSYAGAAPRVVTGRRAREAVFKAARSPRVLVLCTHGFFLPDKNEPRDDLAGPGERQSKKITAKWQNPLLRCGLLLAGCNNAGMATNGDDGILTGLEVVGTDLRGCELVVLSACDTGIGAVQSGEGVAGLRQAFQLAGARAVVSTLWQVPDKQSARLMAFFFQELAKGKLSKAEALRAAKLRLIAERREDYAAAHPFFWAAFTITGRP
jgi:CHAT domain-containing protein/tetratricopeptide (TPR) repeat protein